MRFEAGVIALAVVAAGCGGSSDGATVSAGDVQTYGELAQGISGAASAYEGAAASTTDLPSCQAVHGAYDAQVRPMVDRMQTMSGDMDHEMEMMGDATDADMTCSTDAMLAELAQHDAAACASTEMAANHAEAARHVEAMATWADHQRARADEVGGMMGAGGMMGGGGMGAGGPTSSCQRNGDGTFTLAP